MSQFNHQSDTSDNNHSAAFADCIANSKQIFQLINSILPLESCLRYQILPLELQGDLLTVGMVEPNDKNALNFICPVATSFGYHLDFKSIDSQTHQLILSAYLKEPSSSPVGDRNQTIVDIQPDSQISKRNPALDASATLISEPDEHFSGNTVDKSMTLAEMPEDFDFALNLAAQAKQEDAKKNADKSMTLTEMPEDFDFALNLAAQAKQEDAKKNADKSMTLTEMPEDFDFALNLAAQAKQEDAKKNADKSMTLTEMPSDFINNKQSVDFHERPTMIVEDAPKTPASDAQIVSEAAQVSPLISEPQNYPANDYEILDIIAEPVIESSDFLETLNPQLSCRELLVKVLDHDIDTLQLVSHSDRGRIVCSQNNLVKSSLDRVALPIFKALINEIKTLAKMPLTSLTSTKKVAMERFHQQERIIFRLEFTPNQYGEEVCIHILKGDRLLAYEQQQMDKLGKQALNLAQKLEKTLKKMQICFTSAHLHNIRDLQLIQHKIDKHLRLLDK